MFPLAHPAGAGCVSPGWENCAVPSAEGKVLCDRKNVFLPLPPLCTFSLRTDKPNTSELCVSTGDVFVLLQGNKSEINQASAPFIAQGNLQTLNSICGLVLYILEGIFTNC